MKTDIELGGESQTVVACGLSAGAPTTQPKSRRKSRAMNASGGQPKLALSSGTDLSSESQTSSARESRRGAALATQPPSGAKSRRGLANKSQINPAPRSGTNLSSEGPGVGARKSHDSYALATQPLSGAKSRLAEANKGQIHGALISGTKRANGHLRSATSQSTAAERAKRSEEGQSPNAVANGQVHVASSDLSPIVAQLILQHRRRRFAMKTQQKMDRAMESFVRRNYTEWKPDASDKDRDKQNRLVKKIIDDAKDGIGDPDIIALVATNAESRSIWDAVRAGAEKDRLRICKTLPIAKWLEGVHGASLSGLADIIGEAGDLSKYSTEFKLYKRLGFAPYDGLAGSTWKRESWRPRALTKEEWIANPFSGERYGIMRSLADSMFRANGIGKDNPKNQTGSWQPTGRYGELYAHRRAHTSLTHEEWTDGHAHADALRYMFKKYLRDLWKAWRAATNPLPSVASCVVPPSAPLLGS